MLRGDIHYIVENGSSTGSEQRAGRPAIIVSNDMCNNYSPVVEVVFLTTRPKTDLPTHVTIRSTQKPSIALCEQITSVSIERLGDFIAKCTSTEIDAIDRALQISLALQIDKPKSSVENVAKDSENTIDELKCQLQTVNIERDMYKTLYNNLINTILNKRS